MKTALLLLGLLALSCVAFADQTFQVSDSTGPTSWTVDGSTNPSLTATVGEVLTFHYTHSAGTHGFRIKDCACAGTNNGDVAGVTNNDNNNPSSPIDVVFTPTQAGTFYYACYLHTGMQGTITVNAAAPSEPTVPTEAPVTPPTAPTASPVAAPAPVAPVAPMAPTTVPNSTSTLTGFLFVALLSLAVHLF